MTSSDNDLPDISGLVNLAEDRLGAEMLFATDDFFAPMERLLQSSVPVNKPGTFDDHGQWMDGWESRRRRGGGHDYGILKLAYPGEIHQLDVDTHYFTGNYPPEISLEALPSNEDKMDPLSSDAPWQEILSRRDIGGDQHNFFPIENRGPWQYLCLHTYPDGGIARLRVFGQVERNWKQIGAALKPGELIDLFAVENGGVAVACNDQHYGNMINLNRPGRGLNMGDGWETRRRREPGFDWVIVKLGHPGKIEEIRIDTAFFEGNYPEAVSLQAVNLDAVGVKDAEVGSELDWQDLMPKQPLSADSEHTFRQELLTHDKISHVKINIHPDGGLSRVRLLGSPV